MIIFKWLQRRSKAFFIFLALLAGINSVWSSLLLILINNTINRKPLPYANGYDWIVFVALIMLSFLASRVFQRYMIRITNELSYDVNMSIFNSLRFADFNKFRKIGNQRVYSSISDAYAVSTFPQSFIEVFNATIILTIVVIYFFFISVPGGLLVLGVITSLALIFYFRNQHISKSMNQLRDLSEGYHQNIHDLLNGFTKIKMSRVKNDNIYHRFLGVNRTTVKELSISTSEQYFNNELFGTYSWYIIIGFIIFALPLFVVIAPEHLSNYIVTILFLLTPLNSLLGLLPNVTRMAISLERLKQFETELSADKMTLIGHGSEVFKPEKFQQLELVDVTYEYYDARQEKTFRLGPVSVTFKKGETVFITGGNGSGKSTLINILTGLTLPAEGQLLMDGIPVTEENIQSYRDCIATVFSDSYLFRNNYAGYDFVSQRQEMNEYIALMGLSDIVKIDEKEEFIYTDLSKGQQKRLALIHTLMENKPLLVLDEWAAEQDPQFRAYFYQDLLPTFKNHGKTMLLVTHDDRYFYLADRMVKMDVGILQELPVVRPHEKVN